MAQAVQNTHKCPGHLCKAQVPRNKLMCGGHWGQVPGPLQREVYAAYDRGRGAGTPRHMRAVTAAISAVNP